MTKDKGPVTILEAARILNRHPHWVYILLRMGKLSGHRQGPKHRWMISRDSIDKYMAGTA